MKGPGLRNDLEIRRAFRCPQCGRTVLRLGDVVSQMCHCIDPPVWMQIQPEVKKPPFKFAKIEIPLTDEDLVIRDRPRRMPAPAAEGAPENANDRRNTRPKRPKPERRSFESFQEDLAAKVESDGAKPEVTEPQVTEPGVIEIVEVVKIIETTIITAITIPAAAPPATPAVTAEITPAATPDATPAATPTPPADEFGAGL